MKTSTSAVSKNIDVLIIGAGPFGICLAAHFKKLGMDYLMVGKPMEFWKNNMPDGMYLRSTCDWHLDVSGEDTIELFLKTQSRQRKDVEPLSLKFYLSYVQWFLNRQQLNNIPLYVEQLNWASDGSFTAVMENGWAIYAKRVVVAIGFKYFMHTPNDITNLLPKSHYTHTGNFVSLNQMKNKCCLILGGRQSAFEWAALLAEAGAKDVHLAYRHDTPAFVEADWSWVNKLVDAMADNPTWYRLLSEAEQKEVGHKLWAEGRLKLEPWLKDRVLRDNVHLSPNTRVESSQLLPNNKVKVQFDTGSSVIVDKIILATGYKSAVERVPFFQNGNILSHLSTLDGFPHLDQTFQTNIPGLFITSFAAGQSFGPFFGFTVATRVSAKLIGHCLESNSVMLFP